MPHGLIATSHLKSCTRRGVIPEAHLMNHAGGEQGETRVVARSLLDQLAHEPQWGFHYAKVPDMSDALLCRMGNDCTLILLDVLILAEVPLHSCPSKVTGAHLLGHTSECSSR